MRNLEIALIRVFQPELNQIYRDDGPESMVVLKMEEHKMPKAKGVPANRDEIK